MNNLDGPVAPGRSNRGFGVLEVVLAIVVVCLIVGATVLFVKHRHTQKAGTQASNSSAVDASKSGTTAGVDQLNDAEAADQAAINANHEKTEQQAITDANNAATNVGGAYNENSF